MAVATASVLLAAPSLERIAITCKSRNMKFVTHLIFRGLK